MLRIRGGAEGSICRGMLLHGRRSGLRTEWCSHCPSVVHVQAKGIVEAVKGAVMASVHGQQSSVKSLLKSAETAMELNLASCADAVARCPEDNSSTGAVDLQAGGQYDFVTGKWRCRLLCSMCVYADGPAPSRLCR